MMSVGQYAEFEAMLFDFETAGVTSGIPMTRALGDLSSLAARLSRSESLRQAAAVLSRLSNQRGGDLL